MGTEVSVVSPIQYVCFCVCSQTIHPFFEGLQINF